MKPAVSFAASPQKIQVGQATLLAWQTQGVVYAALDGTGAVPLNGSVQVSPSQTTTYRLTATGPGGQMVSEATVTVLPPSPVAKLSVSPATVEQGQTADVSWESQYAETVTLNGNAVAPTGTLTVDPTITTTYKLVATNAAGSQDASATVTVNVAGQPTTPAQPSSTINYPPSPPNPATSAPPHLYMPPTPKPVTLSSATVACDQASGMDAGEKIAACIAALPSDGGTADATNLQGVQYIRSNVFAQANGPGKLLLGPGTYFVCTTQRIPSNWEIAGTGATTVLIACPHTNMPAPSFAVISNLHNANVDPKLNHDSGIVVHDLVIDGNSINNPAGGTPLQQGIVFLGADYSEIYRVTVQNTNLNGIDLRDGFGNKIHDNVAVNAGLNAPYHSIGGGLSAPGFYFNGNSFTNNKASGGQNIDHYDIFGQYGTCVANDFIGNESDGSPLAGMLYDTCSWGRIENNTVKESGKDAIAVTSGKASQLSQNLLISGNIIVHPHGDGILFLSQALLNTVINNTIQSPGWHGVYIVQSSANEITKNQIIAPGWKWKGQYNGIFVTTLTVGYASSNYIHDNTISDNCARTMHYGIALLDQDGGQAFGNTVVKNVTTGGSPGSTGNGVNDWGGDTQLSGNTYTSEVCQ